MLTIVFFTKCKILKLRIYSSLMWDNKPNYPLEVCLKNISKQPFGKCAYFGVPLVVPK